MRTILVEFFNAISGFNDLTFDDPAQTTLATYSLQAALSSTVYYTVNPFGTAFEQYTSRSYGRVNQGNLDRNDDDSLDYDVEVYAFMDACQDANGASNCTQICNDSFGVIFDPRPDHNPLPTLHNCIVLPNITTTGEQNVNVSRADEAYFTQKTMLDQLFYQRAARSTGNKTLQTIRKCLEDYCRTTIKGCQSQLDWYGDAYDRDVMFGNSGYGPHLVRAVCNNVPQSIQSDVGGVGVYLSYWLQSGFALAGFFLTLFWTFVGPYTYRAFYYLWPHRRPRNERAELAWRNSQKHLSRLAVALVDFQKAQCFFMAATGIAAIIVTKDSGLEAESLQMIYNTFFFLRLIGVGGFLPVSFTLFNLYLLDMLSWYLISLSTISYFLAVGTLVSVGSFSPTGEDIRYLQELASSGGPESCDGRQPGVYCYRNFRATDVSGASNIGARAFNVFAFCIVVTLFLIFMKTLFWHGRFLDRQLDSLGSVVARSSVGLWKQQRAQRAVDWCKRSSLRIWRHPTTKLITFTIVHCSTQTWTFIRNFTASTYSKHPLPARYELSLSRSSNHIQAITLSAYDSFSLATRSYIDKHGLRHIILRILLHIIHIIFFCTYIAYMVSFLSDLYWFASNGISNPNGWSFGQVVALSVWLPPISEYIYLELRGVQKGFQYRLRPMDYKVVSLRNLSWIKDEEEEEEGEEGRASDVEGGQPAVVQLGMGLLKPGQVGEKGREREGSEGASDVTAYLLPEPELPSRMASIKWDKDEHGDEQYRPR